jgi:serine protease Do
VVGINTMIFSRSGGNEGVGFSIPSNLAKKVYTQLVKTGKVSRGYLGVNLQTLTPAMAKSIGYSGSEGALVGDLTEGGPADRAGLRSGDVITEFDGQTIRSSKQLTELVADAPVGKTVRVKYVRDGQAQTAMIELGERPGHNEVARGSNNRLPGRRLGISTGTITPQVASEMKLKIASGAIIEQVQPGSPAAEARLQRGDVIHRLNRAPIRSAEELTATLRSVAGEKEIALQIERNRQLMFVTVTLG